MILDPGQEEAQVVFETDQRLGHTQICPTDSNLLFYVHETGRRRAAAHVVFVCGTA